MTHTTTQPRPDRTLGPGHDEFWESCNREQLCLPRCNNCQQLAWPISPQCEHCGSSTFTWQRLSGRGKVVSWCSFAHDYYRGMLSVPYDNILVELEEGPLFISNPMGFSNHEITPNLAVRVTFIDCEDTAGAFKLPVFARA